MEAMAVIQMMVSILASKTVGDLRAEEEVGSERRQLGARLADS
jgi:hypothetical protein